VLVICRFFKKTLAQKLELVMRILHTSDWHLGKRLESFSRLEEQVAVMDEICTIAEKEEADAVLIAGDRKGVV